MNLKILYTVSLIVFHCGNTYCQPREQAPSALETLGAIAKDDKGFDNGINISEFSGQASLDNAFIPVPTLNIMQPDLAVEKGVTNELSVYYRKELGNPPSNVETSKIEQALNLLNDSKLGKEICKSIGKTGCTWEDFKAAKIEITTRDLKYHLPELLESIIARRFASDDPTAAVPPPSSVEGRTILCLDQELISKHSPAYIATYVLHELSHIADNRKLGEWQTTTTHLATEDKAVAVQMMIHDEFLRTGKLKADTSNGVQFILSVYHWKNGGPKPNMDFSTTVADKHYTAKKIIGSVLRPDDTGLKAILHITKLFYNITEGTLTERDVRYWQGIRGAIKELEPKYQSWFPSKPPAVVTPPIPQPPVTPSQPPVTPSQPPTTPNHPSDNNGDDDSDGGNNSNGGDTLPHNPPPVNGGGSGAGGVDWHDGSHWGEN